MYPAFQYPQIKLDICSLRSLSSKGRHLLKSGHESRIPSQASPAAAIQLFYHLFCSTPPPADISKRHSRAQSSQPTRCLHKLNLIATTSFASNTTQPNPFLLHHPSSSTTMFSPLNAQRPSPAALGHYHPLCHHNISIHPCARTASLTSPPSAIAPGAAPCRTIHSRINQSSTGFAFNRMASSASPSDFPRGPTLTGIRSSSTTNSIRSPAVGLGEAASALATTAPASVAASAAAPPGPEHPPSSPPLVPLPEGVYPTFVPRNPGIRDGEWGHRDEVMVRQALQDAARQVVGSGGSGGGGGTQQQQRQQSVTDRGGSGLSAEAAPAMTPSTVEVLSCNQGALQGLMDSLGQPRYRAQQLVDGVLRGAKNVGEIKEIPKPLRSQLLSAGVRTGRSLLHHSVGDVDGTRKFLLQLHDGRIIETVGIPTEDRLTVCVSSQVGCPMRCTFCATGKGGFARNLSPGEIVDQVLTVQEQFGRRVSNVVFMGMGEPMLNMPSVTAAYTILNTKVGIGGQSITISTVGVPNTIRRLAEAPGKATLAVSLHAPNQELRESLIPSAKAYPLEALMEDCAHFLRTTGRRITFEYTLLSHVNDSTTQVQELIDLLRTHGLLASHVNLIPWNPVDESSFQRPSRNRVFAFQRALEEGAARVMSLGNSTKPGQKGGFKQGGAGVFSATIRETRGLEAAAACGQLRNQFQKQPLPGHAVPL